MNKIRTLEQRWNRYRARKIVSFLLFFTILYAVSAGGYYIFLNWNSLKSKFFPSSKTSIVEEKESLKKENIIETVVIPKEESIVEKVVTPKEEKKEEEIKVEELYFTPIIPIIDMEAEKKHSYRRPASVHRVKKTHSKRVKAKPSTYLTARELSKISTSKKKYTSNVRDTTNLRKVNIHSNPMNYIETIKNKFAKRKSYRNAILLAKAFYREKDYKKSEKWALIANNLNSNSDDSWIIFAEIKARVGKREEAINLLSMYYKKSKSSKVKRVIEKIRMGRI